jgi:hypothetical protein
LKLPLMNAGSEANWDADIELSSRNMRAWLASVRPNGVTRPVLELEITKLIESADWANELPSLLATDSRLIKILRSLTRRDIGSEQFSQFIGIGKSRLERLEGGQTVRGLSAEAFDLAADLLLNELDSDLAPWVLDQRPPTQAEVGKASVVGADRVVRRVFSTQIRYMHEPRQLDVLEDFLLQRGYRKVSDGPIADPRCDTKPGEFGFRRSVVGTVENGSELSQSVDVVVKPFGSNDQQLPIFIEAKSMSDVVNPNKRQKEEAQKAASLRRKWERPDDRVNFILLLGGTVPRRYLAVERDSGLDWFWEHRVTDLDLVLSQFGSSPSTAGSAD